MSNISLCLQMTVCLSTLQHQDADLTNIHLKSAGFFNFIGLWIKYVTGLFEPNVPFVTSVLKILVSFTLLEKNISRSKVYTSGCTQKKQGSSCA